MLTWELVGPSNKEDTTYENDERERDMMKTINERKTGNSKWRRGKVDLIM